MSIQPMTSAIPHALQAKTTLASHTKASQQQSLKTPTADAQDPRGLELYRRELASRTARPDESKRPHMPPERLLRRLDDAGQRPMDIVNGREFMQRPNAESPQRPSMTASAEAAGQNASAPRSSVSVDDVTNTLAKLNVETITETGEPVTQEWIDNKLAELNASGVQTASSPEQTYEITMEGLLANWGKSDSIYDLTGNGTVDGDDLLTLLNEGGTMTVKVPEGSSPETSLEGLMAAWGKADSMYDFNEDGTVDGSDLLLFLQQMNDES